MPNTFLLPFLTCLFLACMAGYDRHHIATALYTVAAALTLLGAVLLEELRSARDELRPPKEVDRVRTDPTEKALEVLDRVHRKHLDQAHVTASLKIHLYHLERHGLVEFLPSFGAWVTTEAGRAAVSDRERARRLLATRLRGRRCG